MGQKRKINCIFDGLLYSKQKECLTATCINLGKCQKHGIKGKSKLQQNKHGVASFI